jgi:hypothetical protein
VYAQVTDELANRHLKNRDIMGGKDVAGAKGAETGDPLSFLRSGSSRRKG